jgi:hypothetical protein
MAEPLRPLVQPSCASRGPGACRGAVPTIAVPVTVWPACLDRLVRPTRTCAVAPGLTPALPPARDQGLSHPRRPDGRARSRAGAASASAWGCYCRPGRGSGVRGHPLDPRRRYVGPASAQVAERGSPSWKTSWRSAAGDSAARRSGIGRRVRVSCPESARGASKFELFLERPSFWPARWCAARQWSPGLLRTQPRGKRAAHALMRPLDHRSCNSRHQAVARVWVSYASLVTATVTDMVLPGAPL